MTTPCFHCGEAVPAGFSATLEIKGKNEPFCCYGCLAVAEVIAHEGLDNFYAHRTEFSPKAEELNPGELKQLELYDDPLRDFYNRISPPFGVNFWHRTPHICQ